MSSLTRSFRSLLAACLVLAATGGSLAAAGSTEDALATLQDAYTRSVLPGEQADAHRALLATIFARLQRSYAREIDLAEFAAAATQVLQPLPAGTGDPADVFKKAVNAALRTLDPYSRYLDAHAYSDERIAAAGSFGGIGLQVEPGDGSLRVVATVPESPAARAGLQPGDDILRIDNEPVAGVPVAQAASRMRGAPGTPVSLTIRRQGSGEEVTLALTRDTIRRQLMRWHMEGDVLVLRVASFSGPVTAALTRAIADATAAGTPRAAILDLRGNPGGLLREGVALADAFLDKGEIVSLRGRTPASTRSWKADSFEVLAGVPLLVLVDGRTASASELVADALQDNGRAQVMGQRSYGKGSVQTTYPLGENKGGLKLTSALYHGPSGRTVQRIGVAPDIEVFGPAVTAAPRHDSTTDTAQAAPAPARSPKLRVPQDRCPAMKAPDPVLSCAVAYLQAGSLEAFMARLGLAAVEEAAMPR